MTLGGNYKWEYSTKRETTIHINVGKWASGRTGCLLNLRGGRCDEAAWMKCNELSNAHKTTWCKAKIDAAKLDRDSQGKVRKREKGRGLQMELHGTGKWNMEDFASYEWSASEVKSEYPFESHSLHTHRHTHIHAQIYNLYYAFWTHQIHFDIIILSENVCKIGWTWKLSGFTFFL